METPVRPLMPYPGCSSLVVAVLDVPPDRRAGEGEVVEEVGGPVVGLVRPVRVVGVLRGPVDRDHAALAGEVQAGPAEEVRRAVGVGQDGGPAEHARDGVGHAQVREVGHRAVADDELVGEPGHRGGGREGARRDRRPGKVEDRVDRVEGRAAAGSVDVEVEVGQQGDLDGAELRAGPTELDSDLGRPAKEAGVVEVGEQPLTVDRIEERGGERDGGVPLPGVGGDVERTEQVTHALVPHGGRDDRRAVPAGGGVEPDRDVARRDESRIEPVDGQVRGGGRAAQVGEVDIARDVLRGERSDDRKAVRLEVVRVGLVEGAVEQVDLGAAGRRKGRCILRVPEDLGGFGEGRDVGVVRHQGGVQGEDRPEAEDGDPTGEREGGAPGGERAGDVEVELRVGVEDVHVRRDGGVADLDVPLVVEVHHVGEPGLGRPHVGHELDEREGDVLDDERAARPDRDVPALEVGPAAERRLDGEGLSRRRRPGRRASWPPGRPTERGPQPRARRSAEPWGQRPR